MNGLQTLTQWKEAFNNPSGGMVSSLLFTLGPFASIASAQITTVEFVCS